MNSKLNTKLPKIIKRSIKKIFKLLMIFFNFFLIALVLFVPKRKDYWIFPVYFVGAGNFSDNMLAVFEAVKNEKKIKKIILTKDKKVSIENGENIVIIKMSSIKAIWYLMRSKVIFVQHSVWLDLARATYQMIFPWRRYLINLWHGIPLKDLSHPSTDIINFRSKREMKKYKIISSSITDKEMMKKSFYKTNLNNIWITGLPRNDFLIIPEKNLPKLYKNELVVLRNKLKEKKLIIYAPTYRELSLGGRHYSFSAKEIDELKKYMRNNNAILGLRYHPYLSPEFTNDLIDGEYIIDLSSKVFSDIRMLIREAFIVITDYSSIYIDSMYLQKKLISFAYDIDHYQDIQRGFFYEFNEVFPGEICHTFGEMMRVLVKYENPLTTEEKGKYDQMTKLFFKYSDSNNSNRVIEHVNQLIKTG